MCYELYIGADELLTIPPIEDVGGVFHIETLKDDNSDAIRSRFSKPHVFYAASWLGCGCGWFPDTTPFHPKNAKLESATKTRQSLRDLHALMADLLERQETVELYLGWTLGAEHEERDQVLSLDDFRGDQLPMELGDHAVIRKSELS